MKSIVLVKQLNNTELGKGGTHDTYVLVPSDITVSDIFPTPGAVINFLDPTTGETVPIRNTVARESRIVGLGQYYRAHDLSAGDLIIFEKRIYQNRDDEYVIKTKRYTDIITFLGSRHGIEILTSDWERNYDVWKHTIADDFEIRFRTSQRKRNDSPEPTDFYDIIINGANLMDKYPHGKLGTLSKEGEHIIDREFYGFRKYETEV